MKLVLTSEQKDVDLIAKELDIHPFSAEKTFPRGSIARPFWSTAIVSDYNNIEEPLAALKDMITPKLGKIRGLLQDGYVSSSLLIIVRADYVDRPEMVIPPHMFAFFEAINAELIFDIAYEE